MEAKTKKALKLFFLALVFIAALVVGFRFLGGDEDTWLCVDGVWVKHGRPAGSQPTGECPAGASPTEALIGGQKDEHGCLVPAGYSWCEAKQKCLRVWEEGCP